MSTTLLTIENPIFKQYVFFATVLAVKMSLMSFLTARHRLGKKIFNNTEDAALHKKEVAFNDPDVERVRRAHRNDMENIPVFWLLGLFFVMTEPSSMAASTCFRAFTIARIQHTIMYLHEKQPHRGIAFIIGVLVNAYMAFAVLYHFW
ncbi:microsomal glutathione S-transferase 1-like [Oratosquilla oratoria]|uniref:microsomal glutathione S-transferase 1-like n=1 Tax=Oratosquilla oratoria TaxID=337810 RepID=UPI003F75DE61